MVADQNTPSHSPAKMPKDEVDALRERVLPTLKDIAAPALRAWLQTIDLPSISRLKDELVEDIVQHVAKGELNEGALEKALISFEEAR